MKTRKIQVGDKNIVGQKIAKIRIEKGLKQKDFIAQIQTSGLDMNPSSYSKLEGQFHSATDKELYIISKLLNVDIKELFEP